MPPETTYFMPSSIVMETSVSSSGGEKTRNPEVGVGHGWHEHVEHVFSRELLHFAARLASHKPDRQKSPAWKLNENDFAKGCCVGLGDGYNHLFGACIYPANERDFLNKGFAELKDFFPEKTGGQPAHHEHDQQGYEYSQKRDPVAFGKRSAQLD